MTETIMTSGEKLHAEQRKRFWNNLFIGGLFAVPIGMGVGFGLGYTGDPDAFWHMVPQWLIIALVVAAVAGFLWGSWRFYQSIDEVETLDNLWSSNFAYATYALLFPAWWALSKPGILPPPNGWVIYLAAMAIGLAAYFKRKWDAR